MASTRTSAQRKFGRGVEQASELLAAADAYESQDAYVFRHEVESRSAHQVTYRCFATEREAPPDEWPLLAGEAIQNLRASLDHMVYAASGEQDMTQFPICITSDQFKKQAARMLTGVPQSVRATIEKAQPYNSYPPNPSGTMLEQLRLLSNLDKHRTLATVVSAIEHEGIGTSGLVEVKWVQHATGRSLGSGETHVSTFTVTAADEGELEAARVETMFSYQVQIEERPLSYLRGFVHDIYPVLFECETGQPLSPFAPYPL
jgi:hypothetical protein